MPKATAKVVERRDASYDVNGMVKLAVVKDKVAGAPRRLSTAKKAAYVDNPRPDTGGTVTKCRLGR